jgi:hypothetical protein
MTTRLSHFHQILAIVFLAISVVPLLPAQRLVAPSDWPIITRRGDQLYEGGRPFRFMGLDAPSLLSNGLQLRDDRANMFPDEFEIRDTFGGLQREGARATRTFALTIHSSKDHDVPVFVSARRTYNEKAFRSMDTIIALAHEYDIRLIFPLIASQSFDHIGGVDEFANLAGKPAGAFWTDEEVKADFRDLVHFVLNRRNTVNGILYKDDPAILAWQLGNEFGVYAGDRKLEVAEWNPLIQAWSLEMAAYIKREDPKHLVMEAGGAERATLLADPNIDIISDHLYEYWNRLSGQPTDLARIAAASRKACKGIKPLIVDEFGMGGTENLRALMNTIVDDGISGGLMWSIRPHRVDGGWYYHNESGTAFNAFHVPGFAAGYAFDETRMLDLLRREAYKIRGEEAPPTELPSPAPVLIAQGDGFTWRGSTGAACYTLERAESQDGPWTVLAVGLQDSVIANVAEFEGTPAAALALRLYTDESRKPGKSYFYRLKALNAAGETGYSNVLSVQ